MERLKKQLELVIELDRLKSILRRTRVKSAEGRLENTAEHSWHVAIMAILLEEYANEPVDISKVVQMLLFHDIVEIDAGDTFIYDSESAQHQEEAELKAAERLFGILPDDQGQKYLALWKEFEEAVTPEARFAKALDRLIPVMLNYCNEGQSWKEYGVHKHQVLSMNQRIEQGSECLWDYALEIIDQAANNNWLKL
ncbi:HD domain-containing protein [Vibrio quintilis]|uniref:HD domain-containing protein n=1 Tax=Vibrio quintilis TaxID=1117707 RepID=UPI0009360DF7|nr:HD domain-containing protein [Vibrio quintilis]